MPTGLILGIESSCDETSAAVVRDGQEVLSNVVASQLVHSNYGGVVPELASREHLRAIVPVVREAMSRAGKTYADLNAIAVTEGPGLAGALLVGITFAKSLAFGLEKPLIAVNHLEGHIHAVLMEQSAAFADASPLLALVVSGGHTHLYLATRDGDTWRYRNVGKTLDDAAGEAYDKAAKLLGLPYPGGPWMDALAAHGDPKAVPFSFAQIKTKATGNIAPKLAREFSVPARVSAALHEAPPGSSCPKEELLKGTGFSPSSTTGPEKGALAPEGMQRFDLSFSGIKTAVRRYVEVHAMSARVADREKHLRENGLLTAKPGNAEILAHALTFFDKETLDLIASFQASVTAYLTRTLFAAAEHYGAQGLLVSGGVAANRELRERMTAEAARRKLPIAFPQISLSTDNAAMIAAAAWPKFLHRQFADSTLEPVPQLRLG